MLGLHRDWRNLLAIATDGIFTRERIAAPAPLETGTNIEYEKKKKLPNGNTIVQVVRTPLGGWEEKKYENGMFFARPGIYFPMNPTKDDIDHVKARGIGKSKLLEHWQEIINAWKGGGLDAIAKIAEVDRFCGAKTSISLTKGKYRRAGATDGKLPHYGQWIKREIEMGFNPMPKRAGLNSDGFTLGLRSLPNSRMSMPYDRAIRSYEAKAMAAMAQEEIEQPDSDFCEADFGDEMGLIEV